MKTIILSLLVCVAWSKPQYGYGPHGHYGHGYTGLFQKVHSYHGNTAFAYNDGLSTRKEHISHDGSRVGSYSVLGADGETRTVKYKAGPDGFQLLDDSGVVKEDNVARAAALAEQAAELAKAAPKAPEVPDVPDVPDVPEVPEVAEADLPVAPTNAPDYGQRNKDVYENRKKYYGLGHHGGHYGGYNGGYYGPYYGGHHGYYAPKPEKKVEEKKHGYHGYGYAGYAGPYNHGGLFQKVVSHHGNTKFAYNDGLSTRREFIAFDGSRVGSYSVKGADGETRTVKYKAGPDGFQLLDDSGVVKEDNVARAAALAEQAAELAKAAPKAPEVPDVPDVPDVPEVPEVAEADLPVAPTNAPDYGKRNQEVYENRKKYYGRRDHHGYGYAGYGHGGYGYPAYGHGKYYGGHHW